MIKLLFVDDEQRITEGLRRMLRSMRHEWEISFASSGNEALDLMSANPADIIISDMRMPRMDGGELLNEIARLHPHTIRIILSGYSEQQMVMRSVGVAHRYLSKPCELDELKATVEDTYALRSVLANENLRLTITQLKSLPSIPTLYLDLVQELRSEDVSFRRVSEIISKDPAMTAKMLQLVNSAFFGLRRHISNVEEAVKLLGVDVISSLVLSIQVFSQFKVDVSDFSLEKFWQHSLSVGKFARWLLKGEGQKAQDEALTAGLLHDVGKLLLAANLSNEYNEVIRISNQNNLLIEEAERQVLGATHAEVGGYLLGVWGLPPSVVEAVTFHHLPGACSTQKFNALAAVHIANALQNETREAMGDAKEDLLNYEYLERINVMDKVETWRAAYEQQFIDK